MWSVFPELPVASRAHLQLAMDRRQEVQLSVQYETLREQLQILDGPGGGGQRA